MKVYSLLIFSFLISMATFGQTQNQAKKDNASVDQAEGIYVFIQSKPLAEYEVLGTVKKTGLVWNGKPKEMYRILLRRAKNDYPNCEGLIFDDIDMDHATCIKFK
jgi:hypothetical protein